MARLGEQLGPEHLPETVPDDTHPVIRHIHERRLSGSVRGEREDGRVIALTVEGGGHRGVLSAGMLVGMEAMDLLAAIDVIYGVSSGGLSGSYAAAGQAALGATNYEDTANRDFASKRRLLSGQSVIDFDLLFNGVMRDRKPLSRNGLAAGPEFRALAVDPEQKSVELLSDLQELDRLELALRASCSIPVLSESSLYEGRLLADGGLLAPLPHQIALENGATDVLALRTRPAGYRKTSYRRLKPLERKFYGRLSGDERMAELIVEQPGVYNRAAGELQYLDAESETVAQITPSESVPDISRTERSVDKVRAGLRAGVSAVTAAFGAPDTDLLWQPVPYVVKR